MSTRFEYELRTLMREAAPTLSPPPDLPAAVAARGRRRQVAGALGVAAAVLAAVAAWPPTGGGSREVRPADPGRTAQLGRVGVQVPSGWTVSDRPPASWCDARPRTVYLGGRLRDPADVAPGGTATPCRTPLPAPVVWVGAAGIPMSAPLPLVRLPGGALGRVELSGIIEGADQTRSAGTGSYLVVAPAGDGSQLVATLAEGRPGAPVTAEVDGVLRRLRISPRLLTAPLAPLEDNLVVVTDNRSPRAERHSRAVGDDATLAAITRRLESLPGAVVDPADGCFTTVSAAGLTDLARGDRTWREFRSRWPGAVYLLGGYELLVGAERCPYVVDSEGGAAGWSPDLLDDLMRLAGGPDPAG